MRFSPSGHLVPVRRRINVDATSSRRIDANTTSFLRHVPAGRGLYKGGLLSQILTITILSRLYQRNAYQDTITIEGVTSRCITVLSPPLNIAGF